MPKATKDSVLRRYALPYDWKYAPDDTRPMMASHIAKLENEAEASKQALIIAIRDLRAERDEWQARCRILETQ